MSQSLVVIKLGGSLLDVPGLGRRLRTWLDALPHRHPILVVGGGPTADVIRQADRVHGLGEEQSHWLAVRALSLDAHLIGAMLTRSRVVESYAECESCWQEERTPILDPLVFMKTDRVQEDGLPVGWHVTTDSIAAQVACRWGADRLILLKSCPLPANKDWEQLAESGFVDRYFPRAASAVPSIEVIDFRAVP